MAWHQSKFWKTMAVSSIALLAALILKIDTQAQDPEGITITDGPRTGRRSSGMRQPSRLESLQNGGLIPWDTTRGIFLAVSDSGDRITLWNLGSDWDTNIQFNVTNSQVFVASSQVPARTTGE